MCQVNNEFRSGICLNGIKNCTGMCPAILNESDVLILYETNNFLFIFFIISFFYFYESPYIWNLINYELHSPFLWKFMITCNCFSSFFVFKRNTKHFIKYQHFGIIIDYSLLVVTTYLLLDLFLRHIVQFLFLYFIFFVAFF